ncbi:uncharacterized protein SPPG_05613 [Spizellomyces punctatus DAOM BR117]|uniref:Uncharacterized protein n=1 Tax=Spizellomyces punctatus (strain DAOM BR117) TaxID=645134 RepID=A0A0L0HF13_SPIPD|nr:uncharacterized protein SPPG_05613 [Spizellomyces punctatus DAOM BR117]KNC99368.1 hypothetical protein SPPG_05613 [Spizellomyces punctatus DAOM BR117]|eukprot:XP_016607408.1 hypothetical protein SPPG_05613 [Spizellomyces punctatus DAOM BR117]
MPKKHCEVAYLTAKRISPVPIHLILITFIPNKHNPKMPLTHPTTLETMAQAIDQEMDQEIDQEDQPPSYDSLDPSPLLDTLMAQARSQTPPKKPPHKDDEDVLDRLCERLVGLVKEATEAVEDGEVVIYDSDEFEEDEGWNMERRQFVRSVEYPKVGPKLDSQYDMHTVPHVDLGLHCHHTHIPPITPPTLYTSLTTYLTTRIPMLKPAVEAFHRHVYAAYTGAIGYVLPKPYCNCHQTTKAKTRRVTF